MVEDRCVIERRERGKRQPARNRETMGDSPSTGYGRRSETRLSLSIHCPASTVAQKPLHPGYIQIHLCLVKANTQAKTRNDHAQTVL